MESFEGQKNPDPIPDDIRARTELTVPGRDAEGKRVIQFKDKEGNVIHEIAKTPDNDAAYGKWKKTAQPEAISVPVQEERPAVSAEAEPPQKEDEPKEEEPALKVSASIGTREPAKESVRVEQKSVQKEAPPVEWQRSDRTEGLAASPFKLERPLQDAPNDYDWSIPPFIKREFPDPIAAPETATFNRPPDLKEIVNDRQTRELFSIFIEFHGGKAGKELMTRIMETGGKDLSVSDSEKLNTFLKEYQDRENLCSEVRQKLTDGDMTKILHSEEVFKPILVSLNEERAKELIRGHFDKMFMRMSWSQINRVVKAQRVNDRIRSSTFFQGLDDRIKKEAGTSEPSAETAASPASFWKKLFGIEQRETEETLEAIKKNRDRVGKVLAAIVSGDPQLRANIADEVLLGHPVPEYGTGDFSSREEMEKEARKTEDTMALRRRIREESFKEAVGKTYGRSWEKLTEAEREAGSYKQLQLEGRLPSLNKRSGAFNLWLGALLDEIFPSMQRELANEFEDPKHNI